MTATTTQDEKFETFFALSKIEERSDGTLRVYARGTQEIPDHSREIMDYETTAPYVKAWSDSVYKDTAGKSYGNIRVMHNPDLGAAGVLAEPPIFRDDEKAIDLVMDIIDQNEVNKVKRGVYSGVSMGGNYKKRWPDASDYRLTRYTGNPAEWSLVDRPDVPTALIQMVKIDGSTELVKLLGMAPDITPDELAQEVDQEPTPLVISQLSAVVDAAPVPSPAGVPLPVVPEQEYERPNAPWINELVAQAVEPTNGANVTGILQKFIDAVDRLSDLQKAAADDKAKIEAKLKALGSRVGIARREGEPMAAPKDYPEDPSEYGDPANWSYPVDKPRAVAAVGRFNGSAGKEKYSTTEWSVLGRRISRLASRFGAEYKYDPQKKLIISSEVKKMETKLNKADGLAIAAQLQAAIQTAVDMIGNDPQAARQLLMNAVGAADTTGASSEMSELGESATPLTPPSLPSPTTSASDSSASLAPAFVEKSVETAPSMESKPESMTDLTTAAVSTPATSESVEMYKMLKSISDRLTAIESSSKQPAVMQKSAFPAGDLQAIINAANPSDDEKLLKALRTGGNDAYAKALQIAGDPGKVTDSVNKAVMASLNDIFSAYQILPA